MPDEHRLELNEFAVSAHACSRKLRAIARVALRREAPGRFTEAMSDLADRVDDAVDLLGDANDSPRERTLQLVSGRVAKRLVSALERTEAELRDSGAARERARETSRRRGAAALSGRTGVLSTADLLDLLAQHEKTGELLLELGAENVTVGLVRGRVVSAISDRSPEGQRLGDVLVRRNVLSHGQLHRTVRAAQVVGRRLGSLLLGGDIITKEQLQAALEEQVRDLFERVYAAGDARFEFHDGPVDEDGLLDLDLRRLLLESIVAADDSQARSA